jgi:hypothetical protein
MDVHPLPTDRAARHVACPECGELFVPRGIAAHRRMRHGVIAAPAPGEVAAPLPAPLARAADDGGERLLGALERIACALESLDRRIAAGALAAPTAARGPEPGTLQASLDAVLEEIERVKQEAREQVSRWGGKPTNEEQRALEQTTFQRLGSLRRRQAGILFRMQEGEPGTQPDCVG